MFAVFHVNLLHIFIYPPIPKMIMMRFILSVVLEKTVRFLTTVDVVLEEYNNCLPNNK